MGIEEVGVAGIVPSALLSFKREGVAGVEPGAKSSWSSSEAVGNSALRAGRRVVAFGEGEEQGVHFLATGGETVPDGRLFRFLVPLRVVASSAASRSWLTAAPSLEFPGPLRLTAMTEENVIDRDRLEDKKKLMYSG